MSNYGMITSEVEEFIGALQSFSSCQYYQYAINELRSDDDAWNVWKNESGIYFFIQDDNIKYIGRSLTTGLGSRISDQINAFGDPEWDQVIKDDNTIIGLICLERKDWFFAASIEVFLIDKINPVFNKRRG